ncbi:MULTISPECIES: hypothetical protein [Paraburkholderia]|uniref:Uncharacterized protein n=1 Tax=Paraburkholderia podalyriae TaxID=1938811 RepID=A0ABR7PG92_9BURK|nr:hypothetical protein [Paraburkholderia podalyriae]MBC8745334.1 hypothetical protein [Paraburkholderia podalyriae]
MKMQVSESNFGSELSDLIVRLDNFPKLTAPCSGNTSSNASQPAKTRRVLTLTASKQASVAQSKDRRPEHCPDSIRRLCSPTLPGKPFAAPAAQKTSIRSPHEDTERQGAAQLLVAQDGTVFELDVVSVEVARQSGWRLDGDLVKTWSEVFSTVSKFRLVSSQQQFQRLRHRLSSMRRKDVECAINAWLVSSLAAQKISRKTALQIKLITKILDDWEQLRVRLRPSQIEATSDRSPNSTRFKRCQEAEIRGTESYREAQKRLQQLWFPMPPSCSDLIQARS